MSETDWTECDDVLTTSDVDRGVTDGVGIPNGGTAFVYGFNSVTEASGAVGLFADQAAFAPMDRGCRIAGAMKRHPGAGSTGFAPFLFAAAQGPSINDRGYMLGLSDANPAKIILRKGVMSDGFPSEAIDPTGTGVLAVSDVAYAEGTWVFVELQVVVNPNGEVVLRVLQNDLDTNPVTAPVCVPVPGMDDVNPGSGIAFLDDTLQVNSGSAPLIQGRAGFGWQVDGITRRSFFDHIAVARQLG